jgi:hypothetical protein
LKIYPNEECGDELNGGKDGGGQDQTLIISQRFAKRGNRKSKAEDI